MLTMYALNVVALLTTQIFIVNCLYVQRSADVSVNRMTYSIFWWPQVSGFIQPAITEKVFVGSLSNIIFLAYCGALLENYQTVSAGLKPVCQQQKCVGYNLSNE